MTALRFCLGIFLLSLSCLLIVLGGTLREDHVKWRFCNPATELLNGAKIEGPPVQSSNLQTLIIARDDLIVLMTAGVVGRRLVFHISFPIPILGL